MMWSTGLPEAYVGLVLEGVFGVDVSLAGAVTAAPRLAALDPGARLRGLVVGGHSYDVTARGVERS